MKLNNMPTNSLRIKFSKTAFLNILKYAINVLVYTSAIMDIPPIPNKPMTFKFLQRSFGKTNPVKRYLYQNESLLFVIVYFDAIA